MKQLPIRFEPDRETSPASDRPAPAMWVRRLVVLRDLALGQEHVVRAVDLRRGLNIIWTPPSTTAGPPRLFEGGMAGHTAGKTTLCRLIRHALGEPGLCSERTRSALRARFPAGWVVAEVVVNGQDWVVARPFALGGRSVCRRGGTVQDFLAGGERVELAAFTEAVHVATVGALAANTFPSSGVSVMWTHLLPWLTRDQECRFADFIEWRHSATAAEAPALSVEERQFLLRTVLGLVGPGERDELARNARLLAERQAAVQRGPRLEQAVLGSHTQLASLLPDLAGGPTEGLFAASGRALIAARRADVQRALGELPSATERRALRDAVETAVRDEERAQALVKQCSREVATAGRLVDGMAVGGSSSARSSPFPPGPGFCNRRMTEADAKECPLRQEAPSHAVGRRAEALAAEQTVPLKRALEDAELALVVANQALPATAAAVATAKSAEKAADGLIEERKQPLEAELQRLDWALQQLEASERAQTAQVDAQRKVDDLAADIDESYARQAKLREASAEALGKFSATFDYVVRALLGDTVSGAVTAAGRSLAIGLDHNGDRDSAAISTVKLLAFDLAALTDSIEGRGTFPRFLLHDGPREADLAPDIYERLFLFVRRLEECFAGEPSFQYIVTTTTKPPEELLTEPWHRLTIAGVPTSERLLKVDL